MGVDGAGGQAVADDEGEIYRLSGHLSHAVAAGGGEAAAEIGPQEIGLAGVGGALHQYRCRAERRDRASHPLRVERRMDGVAGHGMGEGEAQRLVRRLRRACPPEADARRGEGREVLPDRPTHAARPDSCARRGAFSARGVRRPSGPVMPWRRSQSSNSGARFRPSTSRM